ncbi:MAG: preprotein translocase subunit SecG [Akkermansiaceae bacterium]
MTSILAANWLNISINLLLVIHVVICLLLALVVLMQRPKQEGLGAAFGGGLTDQAFGARTTDVLQKGTVYLGTLFFVVTLVLAILIGKRQSDNPTLSVEVEEKVEEAAVAEVEPAGEAKAAVQMPKVPAKEAESENSTKPEADAPDVQRELEEGKPAGVIPSDLDSADASSTPAESGVEADPKTEPASQQ